MNKNVCLILVALTLLSAINLSSQWIDKGKYKEVSFKINSTNFSIQQDSLIKDVRIKGYEKQVFIKDLNINTGIIVDSIEFNPNNLTDNLYIISEDNSDRIFYLIDQMQFQTGVMYYIDNNGVAEADVAKLFDQIIQRNPDGDVNQSELNFLKDTINQKYYFLYGYHWWVAAHGNSNSGNNSFIISCNIENSKISNLKVNNINGRFTNFLNINNYNDFILLSDYSKKINNQDTYCGCKSISYLDLTSLKIDSLFEICDLKSFGEFTNKIMYFINNGSTVLFSFNSNFYFYDIKNKQIDSTVYNNNIEYFTLYNSSPIAFVKSDKNFYLTNILLGKIIDSLTFDSDFNIEQQKWIGDKLFLSCSDGKLRCFDINNFNFKKNDFTSNKLISHTMDEINFSLIANKELKSVKWDFGDGDFSMELYPNHIYKFPGNYTVILIINDGSKSDTIIKKDYIEIIPPLKCDFSSDVTKGLPPINVQFENLSSGNILKYDWDLGDGFSSPEINPPHIYTTKGSYHVRLKVTDKINSLINSKDFYINCDTVNIKIIQETGKLNLNTYNSSDIESVFELPLRGSEFYPGIDVIWFYILKKFIGNYPNPTYLSENISLIKIENNNMDYNNLNASHEWWNGEDVVKLKSTEFNNLYMQNFYPDSCNHNKGIFSQNIFPIFVTTIKNEFSYLYPGIKPDDTLRKFARMYNSKNLTISSANYFPVELNKSIIAVYNKQAAIIDNKNDIIFKQINLKNIEGNIVNFEKINNNEFMAPVTYFKTNKNIIDIIKINALGDIISKNSFPTSYPSLYLHHFIKLNDNEFIGCGVSGDSVTLGKGYLVAIDANGNLIKEITFDNDVVNFKKLVRFNDNEFAALFDTKSENKGYYVLDNNLDIKTNYRFKAKNYEITDFYLTSAKELKFLVLENKNISSVIGIININEPSSSSLITTIPENEINTDVLLPESISKTENSTIYPNPATDYIYIQSSEGLEPSEGSGIQIFDMLGTVIVSIHQITGIYRINIENLAPGIYFIKIGNRVEKFVKI